MPDDCEAKAKPDWKKLLTLSKSQKEQLRLFMPSIACYSLAAVLYTVYICEWKTVLQYVPYYNWKWKTAATDDDDV